MGSLLAAFVSEVIVITYRTYKQGWTRTYPLPAPLPADYVAAAGIYGVLMLISESERLAQPATLFAWGLVIATFLQLWDPSQIGKVKAGQAPGQTLGGLFSNPQAKAAGTGHPVHGGGSGINKSDQTVTTNGTGHVNIPSTGQT